MQPGSCSDPRCRIPTRLLVTRWWIPGLEGFWLGQMALEVVFNSRCVAGRLLMTMVDLSANVVWKVKELTGREG